MNLTEHITPGGPLLEVLRRTETSLRDEPYDHMDWKQCTCGHIYRGATGSTAPSEAHVYYAHDVTFRQVLQFIADVNAIETFGSSADHLTSALSHATSVGAERNQTGNQTSLRYNEARRESGLQLIRTAIATCEAEQLAAMHAVADEARRVVSLVDVPESVLA